MNSQIKGFYFLISFLMHVVIVVSFIMFSHDATFQKNFIVLGVHSQKPTKAFYKATHYSSSVSASSLSSKKTNAKITSNKKNIRKAPSQKPARAACPVALPLKKQKSIRVKTLPVQEKKKVQPEKMTTIEERKEKKAQTVTKKSSKKVHKKEKQIAQKKEKLLVTTLPLVKQSQEVVQAQKEKMLEKLDHTATATGVAYADQSSLEADNSDCDEALEFTLGELSNIRLRGYYEHIQKEVSRLWRPPVGVPKGTECTLSFGISKNGKVERFDIIKRSSMLLYDLSILRVAQHFSFDKCLWGKNFTIDFRQ
jgi:hypothetical protein